MPVIEKPRTQLLASSIVSNTNINNLSEWNDVSGTNIIYIDATSNINITGVMPYRDGILLAVVNTSTTNKTLTIKPEDSNSTAENRFTIAQDIVLNPNEGMVFFYKTDRWKTFNIPNMIPKTLTSTPSTGVAPLSGIVLLTSLLTVLNGGLIADHNALVTEFHEFKDEIKRHNLVKY